MCPKAYKDFADEELEEKAENMRECLLLDRLLAGICNLLFKIRKKLH